MRYELRIALVGRFVAILTLACSASIGYASVQLFDSRAAFASASPILQSEHFNTLFASTTSVDLGDFVASTDASTFLENTAGVLFKSGQGVIPSSLTLFFDRRVYAFGIDVLDFGARLPGELYVSTDTGSLAQVPIAERTEDEGAIPRMFFGVIDTAGFHSITFTNTTDGDAISWDFAQFDAVPPPCPGDINGDRIVNGADLSFLLGVFGTQVAEFPAASSADLNGDGIINAADLSVLLSLFGTDCL